MAKQTNKFFKNVIFLFGIVTVLLVETLTESKGKKEESSISEFSNFEVKPLTGYQRYMLVKKLKKN